MLVSAFSKRLQRCTHAVAKEGHDEFEVSISWRGVVLSSGTSGARSTGGLRRRCCISCRNGFGLGLSSCTGRERPP